jgi:hypothetical protein
VGIKEKLNPLVTAMGIIEEAASLYCQLVEGLRGIVAIICSWCEYQREAVLYLAESWGIEGAVGTLKGHLSVYPQRHLLSSPDLLKRILLGTIFGCDLLLIIIICYFLGL